MRDAKQGDHAVVSMRWVRRGIWLAARTWLFGYLCGVGSFGLLLLVLYSISR